jgi:hypothetical protein
MPNLAALHKSGAPEQYISALRRCLAKILRPPRFGPSRATPPPHAALHYDGLSVYDAPQVQEIDFIAMVAQAEKTGFKHLNPPLFCAFPARMCCVITKFSALPVFYLDFMIAYNNQC